MSRLEKYFSQFEEKELEDNFSELVRKYNEKEKREPRNVESAFFYPIKVGSSVLFGASFQDYKNDIERRKSEGIEIQAIRDFYQKKVIDKFLSDKRLSEIYEKIKVGEPIKNPPFSNIMKKWSFWSNVHRVQDIIKLEKFLKELPLQQPETNNPDETKKENDNPKTFEELFYNPDLVMPCIDVLKELDPPLIDIDCNFIGKSKGAICVWIDELQRQGIVKSISDRKILVSLIEKKIKQFTIHDSMFNKYHVRAEKQYKTEIRSMVSKIKLSQDSQNSH